MPPKKKITLSFSGCGFLGIYHIGVVSCFREFEEYIEIERMAGASGGAITAALYLCKGCVGKATVDVLKLATSARASPVGPLSPRFNVVRLLRHWLFRELPTDAHIICSGRLSVSLTRCRDGKNFIVSNFDSKEELIQVLMCSAFVPLYSGFLPPYYKDGRYWDGGISNNLPVFDGATVTVSPFSGESDICPADVSAVSLMEMNFSNQSFRVNSTNAYRLSRALFPPHPDILKEICEEGYVDAFRYIKKTLLHHLGPEPLIPSEPSSPPSETVEMEEMEEMEEMKESDLSVLRAATVLPLKRSGTRQSICQLLERYSSDTARNLPNSVVEALREASASVQHPMIRALSIAAIPWILPLEFMYSTCIRLIDLAPKPTTMEMQHYMNVFSSIAQRVAGRILSHHGGKGWLQHCNCKVETVQMPLSGGGGGGSRCVLHGKATINQTHTLQFAFAIVEESPSDAFINEEAGGRPSSFRLASSSSESSDVMESAVLTAAIRCEDGTEDMLDFAQSCDIVERFEQEIARYFREQMQLEAAGVALNYSEMED